MTNKRIETALSEEVYNLVKEVSTRWGMTVKSYVAKVVTEAALEDNERFDRVLGARVQSVRQLGELEPTGQSTNGESL